MEGPSGVLALVLAETAAGTAALSWLTGLWGNVKRGFFVLTGAVALACALMATSSAAAGAAGTGRGRTAIVLAALTTVLLGLSLAALVLKWGAVGRVLGMASVPAGVAALVALARLASPSFGGALAQLLAGAAFMGAVTAGLLLGHWYLVDRRLPRTHIQRLALILLGTVVLEAGAVLLSGFGEREISSEFSPFLALGGLATWLALGMVGATALIAVLIHASLRGEQARAVQAATGFFYLAVITAFAAEMAAKVRLVG